MKIIVIPPPKMKPVKYPFLTPYLFPLPPSKIVSFAVVDA